MHVSQSLFNVNSLFVFPQTVLVELQWKDHNKKRKFCTKKALEDIHFTAYD